MAPPPLPGDARLQAATAHSGVPAASAPSLLPPCSRYRWLAVFHRQIVKIVYPALHAFLRVGFLGRRGDLDHRQYQLNGGFVIGIKERLAFGLFHAIKAVLDQGV